MRIEEQKTRPTLQEHDDDDDDEHILCNKFAKPDGFERVYEDLPEDAV